MRALPIAIVAAAIAAGIAAADGASQPVAAQGRSSSGEASTFAVLRRDGVVVPFVSYDGSRWSNRWPQPGRRVDIPISVDASPRTWWLRDLPVSSWTAWPLQGDSRVIRVRNPVNLTVQCERHVGLQTDYSSTGPPVPRDMQPHPKDGLATTGDVAVEPVEVLTPASPDWAKVLEAVKEPFAASEAKAASKSPRYAEQDAKRRGQFSVEIEVLYRTPGPRPGTRVFYFEAVRRYSRKPLPSMIVAIVPDRRPLAYGAGWAEMDGSGAVALRGAVPVELSDNEREDLLYVMPLGSFRLGGRRYWAVQRQAGGYERYEILEIAEPDTKVAFKTAGGTCR